MSVYVIASLTIKDAVGSRITDGCCCQQWRNMAPDWLRAADRLFSREAKVWLLVGIPVIASFDRIGIWKLIRASRELEL